jgi:hypothetical protein
LIKPIGHIAMKEACLKTKSLKHKLKADINRFSSCANRGRYNMQCDFIFVFSSYIELLLKYFCGSLYNMSFAPSSKKKKKKIAAIQKVQALFTTKGF